MAYESRRPDICLFHAAGAPREALDQLAYGMEEEGIPYRVETCAEGSRAAALAWDAAQASRLGVGVGADGAAAVLHTARLEEDKPLFSVSIRSNEGLRSLGANAARLVKKLPLKQLT